MTRFILWGVAASPYQLKMQAMTDYAGHKWVRWPDQGRWLHNVRFAMRLNAAKIKGKIKKFNGFVQGLDEYPAVPFYAEDGKDIYYDSTAMAHHLDQHSERHDRPLIPADPEIGFLCQLIDEAYDEFGLYMVHHNRWVISAEDHQMLEETAREFGKLIPFFFSIWMLKYFGPRQVRRTPYLFSVAPEGYTANVSPSLVPQSRKGFPPTHDILNQSWRAYLAAMENILTRQPYLLGDRFTLADASAYGQLNMNHLDPTAYRLLQERAPETFKWLKKIEAGQHKGACGALYVSDALRELLDIIGQTFISLMVQNEAAYEKEKAAGGSIFNEKAFFEGRALYDGEVLHMPFRSVVKSFQVNVWRSLKSAWAALPKTNQAHLKDILPLSIGQALEGSS